MKNIVKQKMLRMETDAMFPYLVEIEYVKENDTSEIFRFANSDEDISYDGDVYSASSFSVTPPDRSETSIGNAKISISAVDQLWIERIRSTSKRSKIRFIAVIVYDENNTRKVEPIEEMVFTLTKVSWNESVIQWDMEFDDKLSIVIPLEVIDTRICPSLA